MNKDILRIAGVFVAAIIFLTSAVVWSFSPKAPSKPSDYHIGMSYNQAMQEGKPFVALFYTDWCTSCMRFMPRFNEIKEDYKGKYNFVTVNGDDIANRNIAIDFRIGSFPSVYIVDPALDNRVFINSTFYGDYQAFEGELNRYLRVREKFVQCKAE